MATMQNEQQKKYGRDILLQLRMHPLSLQKPNIQKLEIVKDKLYFHQINNCTNSSRNLSHWGYFPDSIHGSMKPETDAMFNMHRSSQDPFPWRYSSNNSIKNNATHHGSLKNVPLFLPEYTSPARKQNFPSMAECKFDSSIEELFPSNEKASSLIPWSKRWCSVYDDIWNTSCQHLQNNSISKGTCENLMKHEKKVLPIIDPTNGKNILDSISKNSPLLEDSAFSNEKEAEINGSDVVLSEMGDNSCGNKVTVNINEINNDGCGDSTSSVKSNIESSSSSQPSESLTELLEISSSNNSSSEKEIKQCSEDDRSVPSNSHVESDKNSHNAEDSDNIVIEKDGNKYISFEKNSSKQDCHSSLGVENALNIEDQIKVNIMMLKEKMHFIKQEQQKMGIVQSFLRFKKHQLDESFRNLDDKKIEIANWEYNLLTKAKRLHEKECWLEIKKQSLKNKEEKLEERERALNKTENQANVKTELNCKAKEVDVKDRNREVECIPDFQELTNSVPKVNENTSEPSMKKNLVNDGLLHCEKDAK